jgi:outer membrane biogenesis lipoprotein LolB
MVLRLALATIALALLAACGPVQTTAKLVDADREIEAARMAGAARTSPYEFTGAQAYYAKARELEGRARYEEAVQLAEHSVELAKLARTNAITASNRPPEAP